MTGQAPQVKCPTCKTLVVWSETNPFRPFCSQRCRLIDLGDWATEAHRIPGEPKLQTDNFSDHTPPPLSDPENW